jgi:hypothetical protein
MPNELSHLRPLIKDGTITVFGHLLEYVSVSQLANLMDCSATRIHYLTNNPTKVRLEEVMLLAEAFGYKGWVRVSELFYAD